MLQAPMDVNVMSTNGGTIGRLQEGGVRSEGVRGKLCQSVQ